MQDIHDMETTNRSIRIKTLFSRSTSTQDNYNEIIIANEHPAQLNNFPMMWNMFSGRVFSSSPVTATNGYDQW